MTPCRDPGAQVEEGADRARDADRTDPTMRISNDRYSRDLRSIELARRMLRHKARTQIICAWTGLTAERARNLVRSRERLNGETDSRRQRGPSPSILAARLGSNLVRSEAGALAGLCRILDVLPAHPWKGARKTLPGIARGERLCDAFELFAHVVPQARLSLEELVLLVVTVAEGDSWILDHCASCNATILHDQLSLKRRLCEHCEPIEGVADGDLLAQEPHPAVERTSIEPFGQQSLF